MSNIVRVDSSYKIQVVGGGTITLDTGTNGSVLVTGNLDVRGTTTSINTNVEFEDNIITLNYGETGSQISEGTGGFEIDRGSNPDGNARFLFDDTQTWNDPVSNTIKSGLFIFRTDYGINGIQTNSINTAGGDLFLINEGTGKISVSGTVDYENQLTDDDDIPNKRYVDKLVADTLAFGQSTGIADGNTFIQVLDNSSYPGVSKAIVSINSTEVANFQESQIDFFNLRFSGNRIETTVSNDDIYITIPGTGIIYLEANAEVSNNLTVSNNATITNDLTVSNNATIINDLTVSNDLIVLNNATVTKDFFVLGNASITGDFSVSGNYYVSGASIVDNIETSNDTIQNIVTNNDLKLNTVGVGVVRVLSNLTVDNNLLVNGDLTVTGNLVASSTSLSVVSKTIELADTISPSDTLADGGGIILKGTTDKTILYNNLNGRWETNIGLTVGGALSVIPPANESITLTASGTGSVVIDSGTTGSINNVNIGGSTRGTGAFTTLAANGDMTFGDADTDTITIGASFVAGSVLRSAKLNGNTLALAAYDIDGIAYTNLITLTASNNPTLTIISSGVGTIDNMNIGASTRGTGAFTTLDANSTVGINTTTNNQSYTTTGAGVITITSGTAGNINNMNIGASTRGTGAFTTLSANGDMIFGDADTDTITIGASFVTGSALRSAKSNGNTLSLAAYDIDGTAYTNLITLTASNTPTLTITSGGIGTIDNMNIGASTRGTGAFTTLDANSTVTLSPTNTTVTISPGGTGSVSISPSGSGSVTISPSGTGSVTIAPASTLTLGTSGQTTTMNGTTVTMNATTVTMASATSVAVNGVNPTISSTSTGTLTLFNTNITTVNAFQAANTITIGATTGTLTLRNATVALSGSGTMATQGTSNDSITRKDYVDSMAIAMSIALSAL
jgi:hypothetical protein